MDSVSADMHLDCVKALTFYIYYIGGFFQPVLPTRLVSHVVTVDSVQTGYSVTRPVDTVLVDVQMSGQDLTVIKVRLTKRAPLWSAVGLGFDSRPHHTCLALSMNGMRDKDCSARSQYTVSESRNCRSQLAL